jgi:hypothetical protein
MASGHVNRTQRPNTWLHRPSLQREDSPCQLGAVHTWPLATDIAAQANVGCWGKTGTGWSAMTRRSDECAPTLASQHRQDWRIVPTAVRLAKKVTIPYQLPQSVDFRANRRAHSFMPLFDLMKAVSG